MFAPIRSALLPRRGRSLLLLALAGSLLAPSCTPSEDTEPFVPASEGAQQPPGGGATLVEDEACSRLLKAASAAYKRLGCAAPQLAECPGFLRPGGGSGCYEYSASSISACEKAYGDAASCQGLAPCVATATRNDELPTCELLDAQGGAGGGGAEGGTGFGGASEGGAPPAPVTGEAGASSSAGAPAAGADAGGAGG